MDAVTNGKNEIQRTKFKTIDLVYMAVGAILLAVCSWISIPTTVPFTLQTFAVFTVLGLLGGKRGTVSIIVFILLGAIGVPVFHGFQGGFGVILGTTGGYIVGFIATGLIMWLFERVFGRKMWSIIISAVLGLLVCYGLGTIWFMIVYAKSSGAVSLATVLGWCVIPFIIPDIVKMVLALTVGERLRKVYVNMGQ